MSLRNSRRIAWIVAGFGVGVATLEALALVVLLPLKQSIPYTITVDRETGYVQTMRGVNLGNLSETDAIAQSFAVQYILARETFDINDYQANFKKTMMWSQGNAEADYGRDWDKANPNSVHNRYRPTTLVKVTIKSVTLLGPRSAMVRFDTEQTESGSGGSRQPWVATLGYSFSGKPVSEQDRYLNPLGFQVSSYRRDAETAQPVPIASPPPPVPTATPQMPPTAAPGPNVVPQAGGLTPSATPAGVAAPQGVGGANPAGASPVPETPAEMLPEDTNVEEFPNQ
jgi:type IV secretion system protein VirB8